jgi:ABC-type multidrug transport system ATPase subunit
MDPRQRTALEIQNLHFGFGKSPLFTALNWRVQPGLSFVTGDEGRGKTSLLKLIAGELLPQFGTIDCGGAAVFRTDPRTDAFDAISAKDFFQHTALKYPAFATRMALELAAELGLEDHVAKPLYMLSTGSRRKVWLAAAFAAQAGITLLDEPFAALDQRSIQLVLSLLEEAAQQQHRYWIVADYVPPGSIALASVLNLDG